MKMTSSMLDLSKVKYDNNFKVYFTFEDIINLPEYPEGPLIELFIGELSMVPLQIRNIRKYPKI